MRVFVAGHRGMVGSAICRLLKREGERSVLQGTQQQGAHQNSGVVELVIADRDELDLSNQQQVRTFFASQKIDQVYLAAAKVGGILANNTYPADFIYQNIIIQSNVIEAAYSHGVQQLLFLGSSCIYPKSVSQPMSEAALLTDKLEPTNEPYAIAKIAGIKMCESFNRQYSVDYRSVMPTNLYGENDNFHPENSHVIPALIRRFFEAKQQNADEVVVWGSGKPMREFLHVDDMAAACVFVMNLPRSVLQEKTQPMLSHLNIGTGQDCSIFDLAKTIAEVVGYTGNICFDSTKPDGTLRKLMDVEKINQLGWRSNICLKEGLQNTYQWFLQHQDRFRQ